MIPQMPEYIAWIFVLTALLTLILFVVAVRRSKTPGTRNKGTALMSIAVLWLGLQALLAIKGLYNMDTQSFPPKFLLFGMLPAVLTIILTFATPKGRSFADSLPLKNLIWLNIVRIFVELVLFGLYQHHAVPRLMTFEGRNFDILAGIMALPVAYFGFIKRRLSYRAILVYHILALILVLNIVVNALLSTPTPLQRFAFDQPNIAILNFPFNWLPSFIVPLVIFSHIASVRQLLRKQEDAVR